jgi:hypothetical protein
MLEKKAIISLFFIYFTVLKESRYISLNFEIKTIKCHLKGAFSKSCPKNFFYILMMTTLKKNVMKSQKTRSGSPFPDRTGGTGPAAHGSVHFKIVGSLLKCYKQLHINSSCRKDNNRPMTSIQIKTKQ